VKPPVAGKGIVLTLDREIQFMAEEALQRGADATGAVEGIAIVMDTRNGDVLAMANHPPLDVERFEDATPNARRNRAVTDAYEPGSVNKVITAAAAIEAGKATPMEVLTVPGSYRIADKTFHDVTRHGTLRITYTEALARSSNIATMQVAARLGKERLYESLRAFGLGEPTGVRFPGESEGILPEPKDWYATSMGTIPMGQGIGTSPLQMASVFATIANDGVRVRPRLVHGTVGENGRVSESPIAPATRVVSVDTATQVRAMLIGVVENGTGKRAQLDGYLVAGKTGTARVPLEDARGYSNRVITTFVGFAPADAPRLVTLVALNNPEIKSAGVTAAPVFREIMGPALRAIGARPGVAIGRPAGRR
jgi:cell division protein FtsI (penicillin-binding protein 3)